MFSLLHVGSCQIGFGTLNWVGLFRIRGYSGQAPFRVCLVIALLLGYLGCGSKSVSVILSTDLGRSV